MANNKNENIKIILLGESGVGKTNLINVFFGLGFKEFIPSNISTNCFDGTFNYNNQDYIMLIILYGIQLDKNYINQ